MVSPELCFVEMACSFPLVDLIRIGVEFCGTYIETESTASGVASRDKITTPAMLIAYIESAGGMYGTAQARRALQYVVGGSASTKETELFMMLCLPRHLGGYGLPLCSLNRHVGISQKERRIASKSFYRCDLFWPDARLALEYESNSCHSGEENIASDSMRRNALEIMGNTVVTMTATQIYSIREVDKVARILARYLGVRLRGFRPDAFRKLHAHLLSL